MRFLCKFPRNLSFDDSIFVSVATTSWPTLFAFRSRRKMTSSRYRELRGLVSQCTEDDWGVKPGAGGHRGTTRSIEKAREQSIQIKKITLENAKPAPFFQLTFHSSLWIPQGNSATGDCCSKCFRELQKKNNDTSETSSASQSPSSPTAPSPTCTVVKSSISESSPTPMEVEPVNISVTADAAPAENPTLEAAVEKPEEKKRKKKKKTSYKSMMANMTKRTKDEADIQKEKDNLRKVTGGGTFSKIDRIWFVGWYWNISSRSENESVQKYHTQNHVTSIVSFSYELWEFINKITQKITHLPIACLRRAWVEKVVHRVEWKSCDCTEVQCYRKIKIWVVL